MTTGYKRRLPASRSFPANALRRRRVFGAAGGILLAWVLCSRAPRSLQLLATTKAQRPMRLSLSELSLFLLVVLAVLAAGRLLSRPAATRENAGDNAWRRTAHGWERSDQWQLPPVSNRPITARTSPACRFDTHPAAIALLQIVAAALALTFFSGRPSQPTGGVPASIVRSYQASFFGS